MSKATRRRIYEAGIGLVGIAVAHGLIDGREGQLWLLVLGAALGIARANVPVDDEPDHRKRG